MPKKPCTRLCERNRQTFEIGESKQKGKIEKKGKTEEKT